MVRDCGSVAYAAASNPNGIKTLLVNDFSTIFINGKLIFNNGWWSLPRNSPDYIVLDRLVFDSFISIDKPFQKTLRRFVTCLLVNNNSYGKSVSLSELPIPSNDSLKLLQ